ncbi:hypothetical protein FOQG_08114 [Fusarium oxysporum f. sp. raphani 54005]|uniref:Uncharacterized protein n=2 Tax=Fusarium oxysporum TaxID=5507 RepID=X0CDC1_FUSOX|nr:hypothetical protein FOVG_05797 [Fusarium oxysporum f. sp. pisi HDV247]EXK88824.1 hypothetical protein FOQG_08114 [Fusarium oxysporum f. sp. raphani 54005]
MSVTQEVPSVNKAVNSVRQLDGEEMMKHDVDTTRSLKLNEWVPP